jgi:uncharacterized membrane protein
METAAPKRPRLLRALTVALLAVFLAAPLAAEAAPRSGGSFGGRSGFRMAPRAPSYSTPSRGYGYGGGGSHFIFLPSFGWGWGGYGFGGGGGFGTLLLLGVVGVGVVMAVRAVRRAQSGAARPGWGLAGNDYEDADQLPDRAYVYKIQLGVGRSGRDIQDRLARFASEGDTASAEGLAQLLQQTALELLRSRDSIRYGALEASGPMSLTNGETKMNAAALAERSRFQIERLRGSEGNVRRSDTKLEESAEVLELVVVTLVVASRRPLIELKSLTEAGQLQELLGALGAVSGDALLGLEVIWTPADPQDSLTETDLQTTYPEMRSL